MTAAGLGISSACLLLISALSRIVFDELRIAARLRDKMARISPNTRLRQPAAEDRSERWLRVEELALGKATWPRPRSGKQLLAVAGSVAILLTIGVVSLRSDLAGAAPFLFFGILFAMLRLSARLDQRSVANAFLEKFPDALDILVRNLRTGAPLDVALANVAHQSPAPVGPVFAEIATWLRSGLPLADAVGKVSQRVRVKEFDFFGAAVAIQHRSGGNFIEISENLALLIRQRHTALLRGRAAASQARITARVLIAIPLTLVAGFVLLQPRYFQPLLESRVGVSLIAYAIFSFGAGIWFISRYLKRFLEV